MRIQKGVYSKVTSFICASSYMILIGLLWLCGMSLAAEDTWIKKADMPTATSLHSASVVDGKIYVIGGIDNLKTGADYRSTVLMYDPATDTWTKKADMPTARARLSTSVVDGKIYAIGGSPHKDADVAAVEVYDPVTDTWAKKADMPRARTFLSSSVVNGKIYVIGGLIHPSVTMVSTVEEYDPTTDTWTRKADMPTARCTHSASVVDGKVYVIGGLTGVSGPFVSTVEEYDPTTDTWTRKTDMPTARASHSASVVDGKIYVIGGALGWVPALSTVEI
jgi:N-acetylneuraminic acid mutarotase